MTRDERRFVWLLAVVAASLAVLPAIYAILTSPGVSRYLGYQYNTDDQMVYAAWMRQAMDGRFLFDNRFTTDAQPGLTVNVYFFLLGLIAKFTGIALATTLARFGFSILFVWQANGLIRRLNWEWRLQRMALILVVFGGGLGFLVWHKFGQADVLHPPASALFDWATPGLPVDVWQPEGFVFSSMLTNSLFMASLCLILFTFGAFLDSRESWRPVLPGAIALGTLMNVHSYDTLMIGLVMVAFATASIAQKQLTKPWFLRAAVIATGMIIPALWFVYVLRNDPVFQSRAATKTFSPNFREVVFGYLPLIALGIWGVAQPRDSNAKPASTLIARICFLLPLLVLFAFAGRESTDAYFLGAGAFAIVYVAVVLSVTAASGVNPAWNLIVAWAFVGTVAIYFPGLFQRKLAMGLSIPWSILAAYGLGEMLKPRPASEEGQPSSVKPLLGFFAAALCCGSSLLWLARELAFIRGDVSSTGRHPVYLDPDDMKIVDYLDRVPGRKVVLALPGSSTQVPDANGHPIPDDLTSPELPDLAPIISGLTGSYAYAGHWSETPDYGRRISDLYRFFLDQPIKAGQSVMTPEERQAFEKRIGANYVVVPVPGAYQILPFVTPAELGGQVVVAGKRFSLVKL